jgi:hypothetical protein
VGAQASDSAKAAVDPGCVGEWELGITNPAGSSTWIWKIKADGTYAFRIEGLGAPGAHSGTFQAANGQWTLRSTTMDWSDGGTYTLPDRDTLSMTGKLGTGVWKRRAGTPAPAASSPSRPSSKRED